MSHFNLVQCMEFARGLLPAEQRALLEQHLSAGCAECAGAVDFFRRVAQAARRESCMPAPALVSVAMEMLRISAGRLRLGALSAQLGVTDRHLRRAILAETSISPRRFARVQRFHALLRDADRAADPGWAALAARHGYADQSHLIRELQALAGVTPGQLLAERRAEPAAESDAAAVRTAAATG